MFLIQFEMDRESEQSAQVLTQDPEPYKSRAGFVGVFLPGPSGEVIIPSQKQARFLDVNSFGKELTF